MRCNQDDLRINSNMTFYNHGNKNSQSPPENFERVFVFGFLVCALAEAADIFLVVPAAIFPFQNFSSQKLIYCKTQKNL